jgi:undecaprenyl-diphosphatase
LIIETDCKNDIGVGALSVLQAIILGIIQGLAEFLPISSSGHLVLAQGLFKINEPMIMFDVFLHIATLIPVFIVYRKDIVELVKNPLQKTTGLLIVATIPAVVVALLFGDFIESLFKLGPALALSFFITGAALIYADSVKDGRKTTKTMTVVDALVIGCAQAVAITPGISRSGSTITAAVGLKLKRGSAAKFSFLMSIPAIIGSLVLQLKHAFFDGGGADIDVLPFAFGFVAALLTGYIAITAVIKLIQRGRLKGFAYYVFGAGIFTLIMSFVL